MAETICLPDGTTEYVFTDKDEFLERLIRERLGEDAARFFQTYSTERSEELKWTEEALQEQEKIADGYLALCNAALEGLLQIKKLLASEARLNRSALDIIVSTTYDEINLNL